MAQAANSAADILTKLNWRQNAHGGARGRPHEDPPYPIAHGSPFLKDAVRGDLDAGEVK